MKTCKNSLLSAATSLVYKQAPSASAIESSRSIHRMHAYIERIVAFSRGMRFTRFILTALLLLCGATAVETRAADLLMLQISESEQRYRIEASFLVDASLAMVHALLTDYEQLPKLSPSILKSEVIKTPESTQANARVRTRVRACVLIHCQTLQRVEDVRVSPRRLVAVIVPEQSDFAAGHTEWLLTPLQDSVRVDYRAQLEPGFQLFPLVGPALMKAGLERELRTFLGQLQERAASM